MTLRTEYMKAQAEYDRLKFILGEIDYAWNNDDLLWQAVALREIVWFAMQQNKNPESLMEIARAQAFRDIIDIIEKKVK